MMPALIFVLWILLYTSHTVQGYSSSLQQPKKRVRLQQTRQHNLRRQTKVLENDQDDPHFRRLYHWSDSFLDEEDTELTDSLSSSRMSSPTTFESWGRLELDVSRPSSSSYSINPIDDHTLDSALTSSIQPTILPTDFPITSPSEEQSMLPTTLTKYTIHRSLESSLAGPHATYTLFSSNLPSDMPSTAPLLIPSTMPSSLCHDMIGYRSPINNLTCQDHAGTDCTAWRFLGLNTSQLEDLVNSCPESCQIACGKFSDFSIPVSFRISNVAGFVDDSTKTRLEDTSQEFLEDFVSTSDPSFVFKLHHVELTSQALTDIGVSRSRKRNLNVADNMRGLQRLLDEGKFENFSNQPNNTALNVTILFEGFTIGINPDYDISELLIHGIDSQEYTMQLQRADDFFVTASASSASEADPAPPVDYIDDEISDDDSSRATLIVEIMVPFVLVVFLVGVVLFHRYNPGHRGFYWLKHRKIATETQIGGSAVESTWPNNNFIEPDSVTQMILPNGIATQQDDNAGSEKDDHGSMLHQPPSSASRGLLTLRASLSRSRSKTSTEPDTNSHDEPVEEHDHRGDVTSQRSGRRSVSNPVDGMFVSPMSDGSDILTDTLWGDETSYPFRFPPMIVIDNIDDGCFGENDATPTVRVEGISSEEAKASFDAFAYELKETLRNPQNEVTPYTGMFFDAYTSIGPTPILDTTTQSSRGPTCDWRNQSLSVVVDSESDEVDTVSVISRPFNPSRTKARIPSNEGVSSPENQPRVDGQDVWVVGDKSRSVKEAWSITTPVGDDDSHSPEPSPPLSPPSTVLSSVSNLPPIPAAVDRACTSRQDHPIRPPTTPERGSSRTSSCTGSPIGDNNKSRCTTLTSSPSTKFSRSPLGGVPPESSPSSPSFSFHRTVMSAQQQQSFIVESIRSSWHHHHHHHHQRRLSSSDLSDDLRVVTGSTWSSPHSDTSNNNYNTNSPDVITETHVVELEVPRVGQLGLVIESNEKTGPVVYSVKDYSPLLGLVQQGDRLIKIDGKDISRCSLLDVTRLLKVKKKPPPLLYRSGGGNSSSSGGNVRILVSRPTRQDQRNSSSSRHRHNQNNGYGGGVYGGGVPSSVKYSSQQQRHGRPRRRYHQRDSSYGGGSSSCSSMASSF